MSETEREILELAAKAAGYNVKWNDTQDVGMFDTLIVPLPKESQHFIFNKFPYKEWNPFEDNSDAILLATKLCSEGKMRVQISEQYVACHYLQDGVFIPHSWGYDGIQPQEAFRKCVTHTAAEIGRNMK